jgi:flagellar basal-body rod modification protein FlgD
MTPASLIFTTPTAATASTSSSSSTSSAPSNTLGPNAFITLLTAQLQAQDPLNPMDPNQMVGELTSMNTLQQIIQIRQDLDALASTIQPTPSGGASGSGGSAPASAAISQVANPALTASPVANSAAILYSHAISKF